VITASHNPKEYNGYKVYWEDGAQITPPHDRNIMAAVEKTTDISKIRTMEKEEAVSQGLLEMIGEEIDRQYFEQLKAQSIHPEMIPEEAKNIRIVYTPLHGTGNIPARRILKEIGFENVYVVPEQELPDGEFPTVSYPNPEAAEAFELALKLAKEKDADLVLATDPDADRVGIAMKCPDGSYELVSGNEMGVLLLDYIASSRIENGTMPEKAVAVKSLVSTPLANEVAKHYDVELRETLTGFKWIGDQIARLEADGEVDRFIFGFEESYGYLAGPYVRDKDAVVASMLICEMAAYYRSIGSSIKEHLEEIYKQYGRFLNEIDSFSFPGLSGMDTMSGIMDSLRKNPLTEIAGTKVAEFIDYEDTASTGLPKSNVLRFNLENGETVIVRPSGTEPKIKIYYTTKGADLAEAKARRNALSDAIKPIMK
jgi:phosphoglucomutase